MPSPKRYFHCSQNINRDPEVWEMREEFGDRALGTWLEILSLLDQNGNCLQVSPQLVSSLARVSRQNVATTWRVIRWAISKSWLDVIEHTENTSMFAVKSPKHRKYYRKQEQVGNIEGTKKEQATLPARVPPTPTPTPNLKKEKEEIYLSYTFSERDLEKEPDRPQHRSRTGGGRSAGMPEYFGHELIGDPDFTDDPPPPKPTQQTENVKSLLGDLRENLGVKETKPTTKTGKDHDEG